MASRSESVLRMGTLACSLLLLATSGRAVAAEPLLIVAAENFYGDVARQIAGPRVQVVSILQNPDADPHLFEPDAATARRVADANLLIYNGLNYDPWIERLLANRGRHARVTLQAAALLGRAPGDNPHLWYDPASMPAVARALAVQLQRLDPADRMGYERRLSSFLQSLRPLQTAIAQLKQRYAGEPVTATEPVANDLTAAIGLTMRNAALQLAIMNDSEPGPREIGAFEQSLRTHSVRVLIYNLQTTGGITQRLLEVARQAAVPLVGVSETEPVGRDYQQWMMQVVTQLGTALRGGHR